MTSPPLLRGESRPLDLSTSELGGLPIAGLPIEIEMATHRERELLVEGLLADVIFSILVATDVTLAACLMPNRLSWLIVGCHDWSGRLQRFRSFTTHLSWRCGHAGPLWQRSAEDRIVRREDDLRSLAERLVSIPQRTGLVDDAGDYRYRFSRWSG